MSDQGTKQKAVTMWIVKNLLRGTLTFRGMEVSIPPKGEFDLDTIGRESAEKSNQILVAFEEGYLQNVYKDPFPGANSGFDPKALDDRLDSFRHQIMQEIRDVMPAAPAAEGIGSGDLRSELAALREGLAGDVKDMLAGLKVAKQKLQGERERLLVDDSLSKEDVRARLAVLEDYERKLEANFKSLGREVGPAEGNEGDIADKADLLSNI